MLEIGERKRGREIGRNGGGLRGLYEWSPCCVCGKPRWVVVLKGKVKNNRCKPCSDRERIRKYHGSGENATGWKGGYYYGYGYKYLWVGKDSPYISMAGVRSYIAEHRLIMAKHLGRPLYFGEVVHHKNGVRDDNRIENLELTARGKHSKEHSKGYQDGYERGYLDGKSKAKQEAT